MATRNRRRNSRKQGSSSKPATDDKNTTMAKTASKQDTSADSKEVSSEDVKTNDPEWYSKDPALIQAAANIPFSDSFGSRLKLADKTTIKLNRAQISFTVPSDDTVPGISTVELFHTYGSSIDRNSPLNVAAQALYTHVRYNNSGRKNYEQSDLMMYMIAMSEIYSYIFYLQRIYNCAFMYSQRNYYIGKALLEAQHIDPYDIANNLANFRYWINVFINKVSSYVVPSTLEIFKRRAFAYSNIYIDNPDGNIKDQLYMFVPHSFGIFQYHENGIPAIINTAIPKTVDRITFTNLREFGDSMLENIYGDEDWGLISGDLLRSFAGNLLGLSPISEEGGIVPIYDSYVLHQIKNATVIPLTIDNDTRYQVPVSITSSETRGVQYNIVSQDGLGNIVARYRTYVAHEIADGKIDRFTMSAGVMDNVVISIDNPLPDPAMIIESTRLMATKKNIFSLNNADFSAELDVGSDVVTSVTVWNKRGDDKGSVRVMDATKFDSTYLDRVGLIGNQSVIDVFKKYICFHHNPIIYLCDVSTSKPSLGPVYPASDLNNYTIQSVEVVQRLNEVALLSLFYVPGVSKVLS